MCGYSGFIYSNQSKHFLNSNLQKDFYLSAENIAHRGNEPLKKLFYKNVLLAHTRLAFQDLQNNTQPFLSKDSLWAIVFNGEIYNFKELRTQLKNKFNETFVTNGDTEIILLGFLNYGKKIVDYLEGEYSFVIFKTDGSEVFASRDNFGVKPLFIALENTITSQFSIAQNKYIFNSFSLNFSSEIKGLFVAKKWNRDGFLRQALGLFEPIRTPFENIISLPASSTLHAKKNSSTFHIELNLNPTPIRSNANVTLSNNLISLQESIQKSVQERTLSDVELGVYLSGGIDSKVVGFELAEHYKKTKKSTLLKAFHISFKDHKFDESKEVKKFSNHFNFDLKILKLSQKELKYSYPQAVYYSENIHPYTNGAAKWWLSLFASRHVKGVLNGDGADEILCGYPSFQYANWWKFALRGRSGKNVFDKIAKLPLGNSWRDSVYSKKFSSYLKDPVAFGFNHVNMGFDLMESISILDIAHPLYKQIKEMSIAFLGEQEAYEWLKSQKESIKSWFTFGLDNSDEFIFDPENTLLLWQNYFCRTHLPVQVLNWVGDRMEMANQIEGRTPFLSRHIKNYVFNMPDHVLVNGFQEKYILRKNYASLLNGYAMNPKRQFTAPIIYSDCKKIVKEKIHEALNKTNLLDVQNNARLKNWKISPFIENEVLKTLESFYLVHNYLVEGDKPLRNFDFENQILK